MKEGKAHFLYLAQTNPPRQHYVRYDLRSARRELDCQPDFRGQSISLRGLDGFFATRLEKPGSTLYCVNRDADQPRLACLASDDNGTTWHDYAVSAPVQSPYAIGGCRAVTAEGWVIGSFTDSWPAPATGGPTEARVYFFKFRADLPLPRRATGRLFENSFELRQAGCGVPPSRGRAGVPDANRVNAELQAGLSNRL